ncbi:MAG: sensor histidine kinase [Chloroflexi bacterium]|nr:sensor histidine kinase [Chloroflexota bacterium]
MAVSTGELSIPKVEQPERYKWWELVWGHAWPRQKIISDSFRLMAFTAALIQIVAFPHGPGYHASEVTGLVIAAGLYSILKIAQPFSWQKTRAVNVSLLIVDIIACVLLVHFTGGIHSPFLLYTLIPVLTAALLKDYTVTLLVALITSVYVLVGNIYNPATNYLLSLQGVSDFLVYAIALSLVAALPYAINLRMGQRLQSSGALTERRRISHELHDSVCQTLCCLRWQMQRFSERMPFDARLSDELTRMEQSVNAAEQDARGLLEVLRTLGDSGRFSYNIHHYLEQLKQYAGINYQLESDDNGIKFTDSVELELSMICIEALTNVKKHAGAKNVSFSARRVGEHVQIKIADDGSGFDGSVESSQAGHGLAIMRERAESIGGTFRVTSVIGNGTEILVDIRGGIRAEL